jgi:hypothetical protein
MMSHFFALCIGKHPAQGDPDVKWQRILVASLMEGMGLPHTCPWFLFAALECAVNEDLQSLANY